MIRLRYRLKCILHIKGLPAWGIVLPLLLATLIYISFGNIYAVPVTNRIPIGIVSDEGIAEAAIFPEDRFEEFELTQALADRYLEEGIIAAYVRISEEDADVVALKSGDEQMKCLAYVDAYMNQVEQEKVDEMFAQRETHLEQNAVVDRYSRLLLVTCLCMILPAVILISEVRTNRRSVMVRHRIASVSERSLLICDTMIELVLLAVLATGVYAFLCFVLF